MHNAAHKIIEMIEFQLAAHRLVERRPSVVDIGQAEDVVLTRHFRDEMRMLDPTAKTCKGTTIHGLKVNTAPRTLTGIRVR